MHFWHKMVVDSSKNQKILIKLIHGCLDTKAVLFLSIPYPKDKKLTNRRELFSSKLAKVILKVLFVANSDCRLAG